MRSQLSVLVTEFMDEAAVEHLRSLTEVRYQPDLVDRPAELAAGLGEVTALIVRNRTRVDAAMLGHAPNLKVVGRLGVGLDNIDLPACAARGIEVIPATGANADAVAEYVILAIGVLLRPTLLDSARVAAGAWPRNDAGKGHEMAGRTLGLVGFGDIARRVARRAKALGMRILAYDPPLPLDHPAWAEHEAHPRSLDALCGEADAISIHVPLLPVTRGLFGANRLARLKPGAILVNTSRGGIVDEAALAEALRTGQVGGAAIDVFDEEPLPAGSPLATAPRVLLTPHIGGVTEEANARVSSLIATRVAAALGLGLGGG